MRGLDLKHKTNVKVEENILLSICIEIFDLEYIYIYIVFYVILLFYFYFLIVYNYKLLYTIVLLDYKLLTIKTTCFSKPLNSMIILNIFFWSSVYFQRLIRFFKVWFVKSLKLSYTCTYTKTGDE